MRDPNRIDIVLARIGQAWKWSPDLRLGQLIYNAIRDCPDDLFNLEDDVLADKIDKFMTNAMLSELTVTKKGS